MTMTFVMDVDGTLCPLKAPGQDYADLEPRPGMVEKIEAYHDQGARIVLFTSRNMRTYNGDMDRIMEHTAPALEKWLDKWGVPYDEVIYGKPWPGKSGFYVDDRTIRPDEFLGGTTEDYEDICERSRRQALTVLIPMAGFGSRFRNAGYDVPKYMIEVKGKTLFDWSVESLSAFNDCQWIFVVKREDSTRGFIESHCAQNGISNYHVLELDAPTDGQATTCLRAIETYDVRGPVLIYNIDTYVEAGCITPGFLRGDGCIPCFDAEGDRWSFVLSDENGSATEVAEKTRISDDCSIGAYYFASAELFIDAYRSTAASNGEMYVAPMYNRLISEGHDVRVTRIDSGKVHVLGTPEDLNVFMTDAGND